MKTKNDIFRFQIDKYPILLQYKSKKMTRFEGLETLKKHLTAPQYSIIIGARQVGKTTMVNQLVDYISQQQKSVFF